MIGSHETTNFKKWVVERMLRRMSHNLPQIKQTLEARSGELRILVRWFSAQQQSTNAAVWSHWLKHGSRWQEE